MIKNVVRWQDGTHDTARVCGCANPQCKDPYYPEKYREILTARDYASWSACMGVDEEGALQEPLVANPDQLPERAISFLQDIQPSAKQKAAYEQLTEKQKEVWRLVMQDFYSEADVARKLGISREAVNKRLHGARESYKTYLGETNGPGTI